MMSSTIPCGKCLSIDIVDFGGCPSIDVVGDIICQLCPSMAIAATIECAVCLSMATVGRNSVRDMSTDGHCRPQWIVQAVNRQPFTAAVCGGGLRAFEEKQR